MGDVAGVEAPLGGVPQVMFHGVQVVEVGVQVRVHQDRGVEEDGEGQVEVEREVEEVREKRTSWTTWREDDKHMNDLCQTRLNALLCSLVQIACVVVVRVTIVGVRSVMIVVLIGLDEVLVIYVAIFLVIFCCWRCTLYRFLSCRKVVKACLKSARCLTGIVSELTMFERIHQLRYTRTSS